MGCFRHTGEGVRTESSGVFACGCLSFAPKAKTRIMHISNAQYFVRRLFGLLIALGGAYSLTAQGVQGYYQFPDIHEDQVVFCAEGDIWRVPLSGGLATRLTTHPETERYPKFSPDGNTVGYSASYEGPTEIYTVPITGGLTTRWTYESDASIMNTWAPDGALVYATRAYNKKPDFRLVSIDTETKVRSFLPLDQASEASFSADGKTVFFVRPAYHRNVTKRYQGGTARQVWKYTEGAEEAVKLTTDHPGESHHPLFYDGRIYFITDRDGTMNIWSMSTEGQDLQQHTKHTDFDVRYANVSNGHIVYQHGADLWHLDLASNTSRLIPITLLTDLDQLREKWDEEPSKYITAVHPSPDGDRVVITARGKVFVVPTKSGRVISFTDDSRIRYRDAVFAHSGKSIITLSDETGEFEFVQMPADGLGDKQRLSSDGQVLRYEGKPSPDGKWIAYDDLANTLYILNLATGESTKVSDRQARIGGFSWSPDSRWLAYEQQAANTMLQIHIYELASGDRFPLTTDRANSASSCWSADGKFIYFLSDRNFQTIVGSPWGPRQPEPYFDAQEKVYQIALQKGNRSPFRPADELMADEEEADKKKEENGEEGEKEELTVMIDRDGLQRRIEEVPIKPGNYSNLQMNDKALYMMTAETGVGAKRHIGVVKITNEAPALKTMVDAVQSFELSADGKKMLVRKGNDLYMLDAGTAPVKDLSENKIKLSNWKYPIMPREDWQQIFTDAWRMERDYFYDANMHGIDWEAMYQKYLPLVDRVTTRQELSDLIGRFVGELSALHTSVRGGDVRSDKSNIPVASLGGIFSRDEAQGGYRIDYIYRVDPDYPHERSPLDDPYLDVEEGDVITHVNGREALAAVDLGALIRNEEGKQVHLRTKRGTEVRDLIVSPVGSTYNMRYRDWEYGNRSYVEQQSNDDIGYLHLRAMGSSDINQFAREFYPIFNRKGLIIDVRYNFGGNIDSYILEKLLRKAWMYWQYRNGEPAWNMQYAFRGHMVVLVNENTYSDGEAFADGFRELGLGKTIGTRTWGGEIWLSGANRLTDGGIARAPMFGVYTEGEWRIEGHGFVPDIEVDNLPHETFKGKDAQLDAAIQHLQELIEKDPRPVPAPPPFPDKSFQNNRGE
jgi:tricorn protease